MIAEIEQLEESSIYSYADYLTWKTKARLELIKGKITRTSPAPDTAHQRVLGNLHGMLWNFFKQSEYNLFLAPFNVRLLGKREVNSDDYIYTVLLPDLCVICDSEKIDEKGCIGAPDLIVEVLIAGNSNFDMGIKFRLYQEAGVKEYWMVDTFEKLVFRYILVNDKYIGLPPLIESMQLTSPLFPNLNIELKEIFA